jgi:hypothetical protein
MISNFLNFVVLWKHLKSKKILKMVDFGKLLLGVINQGIERLSEKY